VKLIKGFFFLFLAIYTSNLLKIAFLVSLEKIPLQKSTLFFVFLNFAFSFLIIEEQEQQLDSLQPLISKGILKMSQKGIFDKQSLNLIPDLSLHISLPNSAPSSICTGTNDGDSAFDIWRKDDGLIKSHSDSSIRVGSQISDTELSLANPTSTAALEAESPWRINYGGRGTGSLEDHHHDQARQRNLLLQRSSNGQMSHINHGISVLDVTGSKPIKGIPVYNSWNSSGDHNIDPRFSFNQMPYSPSCTPYSSSNSSADHHTSTLQAYRMGTSAPRFNGMSMESLRVPQYHQYHQYGAAAGVGGGGAELYGSSGVIRSRFMPKLHSKRNMRAPRMRWTSSLHSRFVHAVELLGGHESMSLFSFLIT